MVALIQFLFKIAHSMVKGDVLFWDSGCERIIPLIGVSVELSIESVVIVTFVSNRIFDQAPQNQDYARKIFFLFSVPAKSPELYALYWSALS